MKKLNTILAFISLMLVFSCSGDEKVLNSPDSKWRLLVSTEDQRLELTSQPEGSITAQDVYMQNNSMALGGKVQKIAEHLGYIYLFIPSKYQIEIINNQTFKSAAVLDFSSVGKIPSAICFANSSTAYISFGNDSTVDEVDITVFKITKTIKVGKHPVSLACAGNQIFVANKSDNTVSVIDTRDNQVKATLNVPSNPFLVDVSSDRENAIIISLGDGKSDTSQAKTAAQITVFNVGSRAVVKNRILGINESDAIKQIPRSITVNEKNMAFVATATNLFRVSTKTGDLVNLSKLEYKSALYNYKRDELIVIRMKNSIIEMYTADPGNAAFKKNIKVNANSLTMIPLAD